jgi:hypothetical protein
LGLPGSLVDIYAVSTILCLLFFRSVDLDTILSSAESIEDYFGKVQEFYSGDRTVEEWRDTDQGVRSSLLKEFLHQSLRWGVDILDDDAVDSFLTMEGKLVI